MDNMLILPLANLRSNKTTLHVQRTTSLQSKVSYITQILGIVKLLMLKDLVRSEGGKAGLCKGIKLLSK
jgi:hypothetical protein